MADLTFDAVVVGGGHNGLTLASYLAKAGLSVGVFERRHELGGGAASEELPLPGFLANPHAHFIRFWQSPAVVDLKLVEKGLRFVFPKNNMSMIFDDGKCIVSYPQYYFDNETGQLKLVPGNVERTVEEVARISRKDADTAYRLMNLYHEKWRDAFYRHNLNPPARLGELDPIDALLTDPNSGLDPRYQFMTLGQIAYDLYDSDHMRCYFMRVAMSSGGLFPGDVAPLGFSLQHIGGTVLGGVPVSISVGGTHQIAHVLQRALTGFGGKYYTLSEVDRILVENGKATGITLQDGTRIAARKMVVCSADVFQLVERFLRDNLSEEIKRKVRALRTDRGNIYWIHFALHELPKYKAEAWNPDALTQRCYVGPADADYLRDRHQAELFAGLVPKKIYNHPGHDTAFEPSVAPKGKHMVLAEQYSPPASYFTEREWLQWKKDMTNAVVEQWQWYAPNMTWDNIIGAYCNTPYDAQLRDKSMRDGCMTHIAYYPSQWGRFRPIQEMGRHKALDNLYLASASTHSSSGVVAFPAYCCYKVIVEDWGLEKVWETAGRAY